MTVLARPVPKRVAHNGIRPLRGLPANNIRPVTIKNWRPPVPEPLPPAPLLGPKELLALGVLAGLQIWGWLSGRPKTALVQEEQAETRITGTVPPAGNAAPAVLRYRSAAGTVVDYAGVPPCGKRTKQEPAGLWQTIGGVTGVEGFAYEPGECGGPKSIRIKVRLSDGSAGFSAPVWAEYFGFVSTPGFETEWQGAGAVPWAPGVTPIPLPPGWTPPEVEPQPEAEPATTPLPRPPIPIAPPIPGPGAPDADPIPPGVNPVEPGPKAPPAVAPARPPLFRPIQPASPTGIKDGAIVPKPADPVTVTNPDWHFPIPGKGPITGNGPRPVPEEMAKELGRLEQKLNSILNPVDSPVDWLKWLEMIREALFNLVNGTTYTLTEECNPGNDPNYQPRSWDFQAPGALNAFGVLENRIDALAAMVDQSLRAKQQVCLQPRPRPVGELVTVRFRSIAPSPNSSRALRKELRYRDSAGRPEAEHVVWWLNFEWQAGPAIVRSRGAAWGEVCVWAADPDEGRRVIKHAAAIAGVDLTISEHRWFDQVSRDSRTGQPGTMRIEHDMDGTPCISKRVGPSGTPSWMRDP